jgi:hypothetical protein
VRVVNVDGVAHDGTSLPAQTSIEGLPSPVLNFNPVPLEFETAAFGYLRERLCFEQRVREPLAIRDMRRCW